MYILLDCDSPDPITNGDFTYVTGTVTSTYGTEVVYTCNPSYVLNGVAKRTCNSTGSWTGTHPSCVFVGKSRAVSTKNKNSYTWFVLLVKPTSLEPHLALLFQS